MSFAWGEQASSLFLRALTPNLVRMCMCVCVCVCVCVCDNLVWNSVGVFTAEQDAVSIPVDTLGVAGAADDILTGHNRPLRCSDPPGRSAPFARKSNFGG